jgi:transposase-like protein
MLEWLVLTFWLVLAAYAFWFLFRAKTLNPINLDDLALTWRMHKKEVGCRAKRIKNLITINNETVGFKCECGYEFIQKRLITQKAPPPPMRKQ